MKTHYDHHEILDIQKELAQAFLSKHLRFKVSLEQHDYTPDEIKQSIDDVLTAFIIDKFGSEWRDNEQATWFYEATACDYRINAESDAIELYNSMQ